MNLERMEMEERIKVNQENLEAFIMGGTVLGGGGGGWMEDGKEMAKVALQKGFSEIISLKELPEDATLLTVSAVGAPSAGRRVLKPDDFVRAVELLMEKAKIKVDGLISSEIGALGIVNGWIQSAFLGIPVVDAPCNGRAHPLGIMGSMGLHREADFVSIQTAVGGNWGNGTRVEAFYIGSLEKISELVRESAIRAGGMVAVARNPVKKSYVEDNGAPGAIKMALKVGEILLERRRSSEENLEKVLNYLRGSLLITGVVERVNLRRKKGFDIGKIIVKGEGRWEITVMNEYITLERDEERLATFPDLIMTFDFETARPLISAEVKEKDKISIITVNSHHLILGSGVRDYYLLEKIGKIIKKPLLTDKKC